ncbi:unnamed protein product [Rotaria magnacalcarata]|uniref:Uncharacterized protein n=1 Tax=Rotaria magnacalcarata TaxID=392030 RepID=A0A820RYC2_9BILA|nr:unnamed protein product [Rotaria magnacalcarata]CAF4441967.1 unnamed protein product [Rotaria magnacalcarata]CAF4547588.1 unnamed protein product [Rotaria magnacalcarata]
MLPARLVHTPVECRESKNVKYLYMRFFEVIRYLTEIEINSSSFFIIVKMVRLCFGASCHRNSIDKYCKALYSSSEQSLAEEHIQWGKEELMLITTHDNNTDDLHLEMFF